MDTDCRKIKSVLRQLKSRISVLHKSIQKAPSKSNTSQISQLTFKQLKKTIRRDSWEASCNVSSPSRRLIFNLKDHFQDQIERVLIQGNSKFPSLLQLSSYTMGKVAIHVEDIELEDFYELIPAHCRKWVLSQHLIQILLQDVPLCALLPGLADICVSSGADEQVLSVNQAFQLICGFWLQRKSFKREDYQWSISKMKSISKLKSWSSFLALYLIDSGASIRLFQNIDSPEFGLEIALKVIHGYIEIESEDLIPLEETVSFLLKYGFEYDASNSNFMYCIDLLMSNPFNYLPRLNSGLLMNICLFGLGTIHDEDVQLSILPILDRLLPETLVFDMISEYSWNSSQLYQVGCLAQSHGYNMLAVNVYLSALHLAREEQDNEVLGFLPDLEQRIFELQVNYIPQKTWYSCH
jgi:hypothetical protein